MKCIHDSLSLGLEIHSPPVTITDLLESRVKSSGDGTSSGLRLDSYCGTDMAHSFEEHF